jgi:serine protease SohB
MEFLQTAGLFFIQTFIIIIGIIAIILTIAALAMKNKNQKSFEVEILNDLHQEQKEALQSVLLSSSELKKEKKKIKAQEKAEEKNEKQKPTIYVLDFLKGDINASSVDHFREEISAVISVAKKDQEVIINVESPGGVVHGYGLAAAQILRLRDHGLYVTVCVDKVAASGGYMMACVAHKIISSPFAIIGSIGVVAQVPNFNKLLKKYDVDYKEYTAGDYKRTVSVLGEITEKGEKKFLEQLEATHVLFKSFVGRFRPKMDLTKVATGEYWFGEDALIMGLVDEISTSDDYIIKKMNDNKLIKLSFEKKPSLSEKISGFVSEAVSSSVQKTFQRVAGLSKPENEL